MKQCILLGMMRSKMEWSARLRAGNCLTSNMVQLRELLVKYRDQIVYFWWFDDSGRKLACSIPRGSEIIVFKRNYINTEGTKAVVYVLGWKSAADNHESLAFLQPGGLVEMSSCREFQTTFERELAKGMCNACNG